MLLWLLFCDVMFELWFLEFTDKTQFAERSLNLILELLLLFLKTEPNQLFRVLHYKQPAHTYVLRRDGNQFALARA